MFVPRRSLKNAAANSSSVNMSGLTTDIPFAVSPQVAVDGDTELRKFSLWLLRIRVDL